MVEFNDDLDDQVAQLAAKQEEMMATLNDALTSFQSYRDEVTAAVSNLTAKIDQLTAAITQESTDLDQIVAAVNQAKTDLQNLLNPPLAPPPAP